MIAVQEVLMKNIIPEGFLKRYRKGKKGAVIFLPLTVGFLRLKYTIEGKLPFLHYIAFVSHPTDAAHVIGIQLEFNLAAEEEDEQVAVIAEQGASGIQWYGGEEHLANPHGNKSIPPKTRKISLDAWVDEYIDKMINPSTEILADIKEHFDINTIIAQIRAGDEKAAERFCKECTPQTDEEISLVLALLTGSLSNTDGEFVFACAEPLKRAVTGHKRILEELTSLLESGSITHDYDRSEIYEIIVTLSGAADSELINRWIVMCKAVLAEKGLTALYTINEGHLFEALTAMESPNEQLMHFFADVMAQVKSASQEIRNEVQDLHFYGAMRRASRKHA